MGKEEIKSLTQSGVKYVCQYFVLNFCFTLALLIISATLLIYKESWLSNQTTTLTFLAAVISVDLIILIWLIWGLANIFNGKRELNIKHESNVILAAILLISYVILFLITLVYGRGFMGGRAFISAAVNGFSSSIVTLCVTLAFSITSCILFGFAMKYLIQEISSEQQKKNLQIAFLLLIAGNFTLNITDLIAYFMFFKVYREVYLSLKEGKIKAAVTAPCPNCNRDIPIESKSCDYCGAKLDEVMPIEIDPRLNIDAPKPGYNLPSGYTPSKGPTEAQKKRVIKIIAVIIAIIVVIATIYAIYLIVNRSPQSSVSGNDNAKNSFIGTWDGGAFNGNEYLSEETWTFYGNNSLKKDESSFGTNWYTYEIDTEGQLCIRDPEISSLMCYVVKFSNDNQFSLYLGDTQSYLFSKVS